MTKSELRKLIREMIVEQFGASMQAPMKASAAPAMATPGTIAKKPKRSPLGKKTHKMPKRGVPNMAHRKQMGASKRKVGRGQAMTARRR